MNIRTYILLKNTRILPLLIILYLLVSCTKSDYNSAPNALFTVSSIDVLVEELIIFSNTSSDNENNIVSYFWDFADGETSNEQNPQHKYVKSGNYLVKLTARDEFQQENSFSLEIFVSVDSNIQGRLSLKEKLGQLSDGMFVCAHRASHLNYPENSLKAVEDAVKLGITMVEVDVRTTLDGVLVLMHDSKIDRTTSGSGDISSLTFEELTKFKLLFNNQSTQYTIPTLKEIFEMARGKIYINLDLDKKADYKVVYNLVKQEGMLKQVMFYSTAKYVIEKLLETDENLVVLPYVDSEVDFETYTSLGINPDILHYTTDSFYDQLIDKAKVKGIAIYKNAYINSNVSPIQDNYNQVKNIVTKRGNVIQTDFPELVQKYLNENGLIN